MENDDICDEFHMYPCIRCGVFRTKAEGGTTFTVCDKCWDIEHEKAKQRQ